MSKEKAASILNKKIDILIDYYEKNKQEIDVLNIVAFSKASVLLKEYNELYKKLITLKSDIKKVSSDFLEQAKLLPKGNDSVKQLIKSYQEIDCNID